MAGVPSFSDVHAQVRLNEMFLHRVRPTIQRSRDGRLNTYVPWKVSYETGFVLGTWHRASEQGQLVLSDLKSCAKRHPSDYISVVGVNEENIPVDVFNYYDPNTNGG